MKIDVGKCILVYLCFLVMGCSCFQKYIQALTAKVNELFGIKPCEDDRTPPIWKLDDRPVVSQCSNNDDTFSLLGVNWRSISSKIANNWWIIVISSLLPFIVFWRIQYNMRNRLHEWKKILIKKEKTSNRNSRRLTLPDLTLAKHVRRQSMAEATHKMANRSGKLFQFGNIKKDSSERNDELLGEVKRVHLIRRR